MVISKKKKKGLHFVHSYLLTVFRKLLARGGPKKSIHGPLLEMFGDPGQNDKKTPWTCSF